MTSFLFPVFDFIKANKWTQYVLGAVSLYFIWRVFLASDRSRTRKMEQQKIKAAQAEEQVRVNQTISTIKEDLHERSDAARKAVADYPYARTRDELRQQDPGLDRIIFGDSSGDR